MQPAESRPERRLWVRWTMKWLSQNARPGTRATQPPSAWRRAPISRPIVPTLNSRGRPERRVSSGRFCSPSHSTDRFGIRLRGAVGILCVSYPQVRRRLPNTAAWVQLPSAAMSPRRTKGRIGEGSFVGSHHCIRSARPSSRFTSLPDQWDATKNTWRTRPLSVFTASS